MKRLYPLLPIFAVVLILYHPVLTTYFSQDDFFHFKVSQTDGSLHEFINLLKFHPYEERGLAFYRPIFREVPYNIFYSIFGLNPLPFRILQFLLHFFNIFLVYILMQKIFRIQVLSFFVSFFFAVSAPNVAVFYYLAGGIEALGATMFALLSLIFFINYLQTAKLRFLLLVLATFLLALTSHELAAVLPILLAGSVFIFMPVKKALGEVFKIIPFFMIVGLYLYLDVTKVGFSSSEQQYSLVFNLKTTLNSLAWYGGWALGLPEMLIDFVLPGFKLNPALMRWWGNYFIVILPTFFMAIIFVILAFLYLILRKAKIFKDKRFYFTAFWFPVCISPVIFLPLHKSSYYLLLALPGFWAALGFLTFQTYKDIKVKFPNLALLGVSVFIGSLILLSTTSALLGKETFWAAQRGRLAEKLISDIRAQYPNLPKGAAIYFTNDPTYPYVAEAWGSSSKQVSFVLNGKDALRLFYKDPTLEVFYEDLGGIPVNFASDKIYPIVAKVY